MDAKKRLALLGIFSTTALGALAVAACTTETTSGTYTGSDAGTIAETGGGTGDTGSVTGETVKVGVSIGLSGDLAGIAESIQNSIRVSEDFINGNGGITNKNVQFIIEDDKSSSTGDLTAVMTKFLTKDKVAAIIGPLGSGQVVVAHPPVKDAKIIQLSPSATSAGLSLGSVFGGADRYFFRTVPPDDFQAKAVARFAYNGPSGAAAPDGGVAGCRKMAIISIDSSYGTSMVPVIKNAFIARQDATVVYQKTIPTEGGDFASTEADAIVTEMAGLANVPDCQVIVSYEVTAGRFMAAWSKQAAKFPSKYFTVGTDGIYTGKFLKESQSDPSKAASPNYAAGVYGTNPDTNPAGRTQFDYFRTRYTTKYPLAAGVADIPSYSANTFDAAILIALAIQSAGGTTDPVKVRDALKAVANPPGTKYGPAEFAQALVALKAGQDIDYQGASGDVDLKDTEGWSAAGYIVWKVSQVANAAPTYSTIERITPDQLQ